MTCNEPVTAGIGTVDLVTYGIFAVVILVVILGRVEFGGRHDFHRQGLVESPGSFQLLKRIFGLAALIFVVIEDCRAVLIAAVDKLAAAVGGIDLAPVDIKQVAVADFLWVKGDLDCLGMSGASRGYSGITRVGYFTTGIACDHLNDSVGQFKGCFHTPEAPAGEGGFLIAVCGGCWRGHQKQRQ